MSALAIPTKKQRKSLAPEALPDMEPGEVLKGQGGNGWFNGISNDQVDWPMAYGDEQAVPPTIYRMQAWLLHHTVTKGNRHPYANKGGAELHIENLAADLDIEIHNCRTYWRQGVAMGLWRNGTEEGTKKLYPCARITPVAKDDASEPEEGVCTNPLPLVFQTLKPYMREQLEKLPPEKLLEAAQRYARLKVLRDAALAETVSAVRMVTDTIEDTLWRDVGVEKKRLNGAKAEETSPEEAADTAERQKRIEALLPHVQGYVQTLEAFVQTPEIEAYTPPTASVQTPSETPVFNGNGHNSNGNGRVAGIEKNRLPYSGLDKAKTEPKTLRRRQNSDAVEPQPDLKTVPVKGRSSYTHPELPPEPAAKRKITLEERDAMKELAEEVQTMQAAYKHTDFGLSEFDPYSKPGQLFLLRLLDAIGGPVQVMPFCLSVAAKFKGIDRNALGKMPPRSPETAAGPRGLGLLLEWAADFGAGRSGGVR